MKLLNDETFGLIRPSVDIHTLGFSHVSKLLKQAGYRVFLADREISEAVNHIQAFNSGPKLIRWLREKRISRLGLSYRLDPNQAIRFFHQLLYRLRDARMLTGEKGTLRGVYFAGLPKACELIRQSYGNKYQTFCGDESPTETLKKFGVPSSRIPQDLLVDSRYDEFRMDLGREIIRRGNYMSIKPEDRSGYEGFGTRTDSVFNRVRHARSRNQSFLTRAHIGPYRENRIEAVLEFENWLKQLKRTGLLDIVSIGTSQLTQEQFGEDWKDRPNGGGVPINSEQEYHNIWESSRPMLIRTYAGTNNVPYLAEIHERSLNIAWHALSLWWFCRIDGRGPNTVLQNLRQHITTMKFIAKTKKPFEPNIPHHFAFRGGDDVCYILSAVLAARTAKRMGIKHFILQIMMNTPKYTSGIQDLAKARALVRLVRTLQSKKFSILVQPRAGLDYLSTDIEKAKIQLAAVSMMMDDIELDYNYSPDIVHVVSYSEASHLATPSIVDESIRITRDGLSTYRSLEREKILYQNGINQEIEARTTKLMSDVMKMLDAIENIILNPYSAEGLYKIFAAGFLPTPYLWEEKDEFNHAINWNTDIINGGVSVVDQGKAMSLENRIEICKMNFNILFRN